MRIHHGILKKISIIFFLIIFLSPIIIYADVIKLKNGGSVNGTIVSENDDNVVVDMGSGQVNINKVDIKAIEKSPIPEASRNQILTQPVLAKKMANIEETPAVSAHSQKIEGKFSSLSRIAVKAFKEGDFDKAKTYAEEAVARAPQNKNEWGYGSAIYYGNTILGCIALRSGDVTKAKEYLLESSKTPGSHVLRSFGPNMILAKELLEKGGKETVLQFLHLCENFWKLHIDKLKEWEREVEEGRIPNFGANLNYWESA